MKPINYEHRLSTLMTICHMDSRAITSSRSTPRNTINASAWLTKLAGSMEFDTSDTLLFFIAIMFQSPKSVGPLFDIFSEY
jgi:hypothetical protein